MDASGARMLPGCLARAILTMPGFHRVRMSQWAANRRPEDYSAFSSGLIGIFGAKRKAAYNRRLQVAGSRIPAGEVGESGRQAEGETLKSSALAREYGPEAISKLVELLRVQRCARGESRGRFVA